MSDKMMSPEKGIEKALSLIDYPSLVSSKVVDESKEIVKNVKTCSKCGSKDTYITKRGYQQWVHDSENNILCRECYNEYEYAKKHPAQTLVRCKCGCGGYPRKGREFIFGHHLFGENNWQWKGGISKVTERKRKAKKNLPKRNQLGRFIPLELWEITSYEAVHRYIRQYKPKPSDGNCEICHKVPWYDAACITGVYNKDFCNWQFQCRKCHIEFDGFPGGFQKKHFKSFIEAREFVRQLNLKSTKEWWVYSKSSKKPNDIPSSAHKIYKIEWKGYSDFLGTANQRGRPTLSTTRRNE